MGKGKISWRAILESFVIAVITAFITALTVTLESGETLPTLAQVKAAAVAGLIAGLAKILHALNTDEVKQAEKIIDKVHQQEAGKYKDKYDI